MDVHDDFDLDSVKARIAVFADQVERRLAGEITEDQFRPLRLANGVYLQPHSYMLRVALPHGTLNPGQLRMLAHVARKYDKGYGRLTQRRDIQFNWPALADVPAILADLATVGLHTGPSPNDPVRIVVDDPFAGVAADEAADPHPYAESLRRGLALHPEVSALPRRFRIAFLGRNRDRTAIRGYDIGLHLKRGGEGQLGFGVHAGNRALAAMQPAKIRDFLPAENLVAYCIAILRVHDSHGRRRDGHRTRLETLVREIGVEAFARQVEAEWNGLKSGEPMPPAVDIAAIEAGFAPLPDRPGGDEAVKLARLDSRSFGEWLTGNTVPHRHPDYAAVLVPSGTAGGAPGDISAEQMETVADVAARFGFDGLRVSHEQGLILPHVARADLKAVHGALAATGLSATGRRDRKARILDDRRQGRPAANQGDASCSRNPGRLTP